MLVLTLGALASLLTSLVAAHPHGTHQNSKRIPIGSIINSCNEHWSVSGTVAITFDDGPYIYTDGVLGK